MDEVDSACNKDVVIGSSFDAASERLEEGVMTAEGFARLLAEIEAVEAAAAMPRRRRHGRRKG